MTPNRQFLNALEGMLDTLVCRQPYTYGAINVRLAYTVSADLVSAWRVDDLNIKTLVNILVDEIQHELDGKYCRLHGGSIAAHTIGNDVDRRAYLKLPPTLHEPYRPIYAFWVTAESTKFQNALP